MNEAAWIQKEITLRSCGRGLHLVTEEISLQLPEIAGFSVGIAHLFLLHTSAALAVNESVEPEVREDMERFLDELVPEGGGRYRHAYEGQDDMPAHIKCVLTGASLCIPLTAGAFRLGTWQGIYLCEFRNRGGNRRLTATLHGMARSN